jgi:hypothetical protein
MEVIKNEAMNMSKKIAAVLKIKNQCIPVKKSTSVMVASGTFICNDHG